jgi:DNA polymerase III epsilon subunit-like protein
MSSLWAIPRFGIREIKHLRTAKTGDSMSWIVVDVESDGPVPLRDSLVSFGAIVVEPTRYFHTFVGENPSGHSDPSHRRHYHRSRLGTRNRIPSRFLKVSRSAS